MVAVRASSLPLASDLNQLKLLGLEGSADNGLFRRVDVASLRGTLDGITSVAIHGALPTGAGDMGPAIQAAIDATPDGGIVIAPGGAAAYRIATPITANRGIRFISNATFSVVGAITAFTVAGEESELHGPKITGDRTTNQIGVSVTGTRCKVDSISVKLLDRGIIQPTNAGFENILSRITGRNLKTGFMQLRGGVGPKVFEALYDTDGAWNGGPYASPTDPAIHVQAPGTYLSHIDCIHAGSAGSLRIEPVDRDVTWVFIDTCTWDSTTGGGAGIDLLNNTAYNLTGVWITGGWSASGASGLRVVGSGNIDYVRLTAVPLINNSNYGLELHAGANIHFDGCDILGNNAGVAAGFGYTKPGDGHSMYLNTPGYVQFRGGRVAGDAFGWPQRPDYHIFANTACGIVDFDGTTFDSAVLSGVVLNAATAGNLRGGRTPGLTL